MGLRLTDFFDMWSGQTAYVVGSSAAWEMLSPRFFDDKPTIAVNQVGTVFGLASTALSVSQYHGTSSTMREAGWDGIVFEPDRPLSNHLHHQRTSPDDLTIHLPFPDHVDYDTFLTWPREHPELVQGTTSLHPALHLAAYMGAATIVTVAADHGTWNDHVNGPGYRQSPQTSLLIPSWKTNTDLVAEKIRSWGINVYTLLPVVNVNGEQVSFRGPRASIG